MTQVILASQQATVALESLLNTDGITIMQGNGIFKDVEHYHMHIIPRFLNDGFTWIEPEIKVSNEEFNLIGTSLKKYLNVK